MRESIYVPMLILSCSMGRLFSSYLLNKIKDFKTPDDVSILDVKRGGDPVLEYTFDMIIRHNGEVKLDPYFSFEEDNYLRIEVETPTTLLYQRLDWLEDQIKTVVKEYDDTIGLYFFYLDSNRCFREANIAKFYTKDGVDMYEDDVCDDFSDLQSMAPFLNHYWYLDDEIPFAEAFPDLTAKFLLLFG